MRKAGRRLVIDGNAVYEIDVACTECRQKKAREMAEKKGRADLAGKKRQGRPE